MISLDNVRNIYLLGDLHLGIKNNSAEWFDIQKSFLVEWFLKTIKEDGFDPEKDMLFQAGDWNHVRESTNVRISNESLEIFKILSAHFPKGIHIILGNHDVYYKDRTDVHSLKEVDLIFDNIKVYETPEVLTINNKHRMLMLPWEHDTSELSRKVKKYVGSADYILCHADIKDFKLNKWAKLEHGLDRSELALFKKIYSGHIHIRQDKDNMIYLGTPYQLDRGDHGNTKGFYKLNMEGPDIVETFFENNVSPKYVKYDATDILNSNLIELNEMFKNNFVDVLIDNTFAKVFPVTQFIELVKDCGQRSIEFYPYTSDSTSEEIQISDSYDYNIFDVLTEYLKVRKMSTSVSTKVFSKFKEIHDEIKNNKNYE